MSHRRRKSTSSRVGRRKSSSSGLSPAQKSLRDFRRRQTKSRRSTDSGSFKDKVRTRFIG